MDRQHAQIGARGDWAPISTPIGQNCRTPPSRADRQCVELFVTQARLRAKSLDVGSFDGKLWRDGVFGEFEALLLQSVMSYCLLCRHFGQLQFQL